MRQQLFLVCIQRNMRLTCSLIPACLLCEVGVAGLKTICIYSPTSSMPKILMDSKCSVLSWFRCNSLCTLIAIQIPDLDPCVWLARNYRCTTNGFSSFTAPRMYYVFHSTPYNLINWFGVTKTSRETYIETDHRSNASFLIRDNTTELPVCIAHKCQVCHLLPYAT